MNAAVAGEPRYLDTNLLIRYFTRDDPAKAASCLALLQRVRDGREQVRLTESVFTEVAYVLASTRNPYRLSRAEIRALLISILTLRGVLLRRKPLYLRALDLYGAYPALDIEDAVSIAWMERDGVTEIYSYDQDFDRVPGIRRVEP